MLFHNVDLVFVLRGNRSKYRRCLEGKEIKLVGPKIVNLVGPKIVNKKTLP